MSFLYVAIYLSSMAVIKQMPCFLSFSFRVGVIPQIPPGRTLKMTFTRPVEGRYVTVVLPGLKRILTLCEVEVYGYRAPTGEN